MPRASNGWRSADVSVTRPTGPSGWDACGHFELDSSAGIDKITAKADLNNNGAQAVLFVPVQLRWPRKIRSVN